MSKIIKLSINLGDSAEPLYRQLMQQGLDFDYQTMVDLQEDNDAIKRLSSRDLIPRMMEKICYKRIFDHLIKHVESRNGLKLQTKKGKEANDVSVN